MSSSLTPPTGGPDPFTTLLLSSAISAAQSTGLLYMVLESSGTVRECAQALSLDIRMVGHVLDVLVSAHLLERHADRYSASKNTEWSARLTAKSYKILDAHLSQTIAALQHGPSQLWVDGGAAQREAVYSQQVFDMGTRYRELAEYLAAHITTSPLRILDVGCGSGVWSLEIARRTPKARVTGIDFPSVLESFRAFAKKLELGDQIDTLPGDVFTVELPKEPFDLVIIANVLRLESSECAEQLVTRMSESLRPGGQLLIIDALAGGTPEKELARSTYALLLALRSDKGRVYAPSQVELWMERAGISNITAIDLGAQSAAMGAILGQRASRGQNVPECLS